MSQSVKAGFEAPNEEDPSEMITSGWTFRAFAAESDAISRAGKEPELPTAMVSPG